MTADTPADTPADLIRAALHDGLDYFGTELDDVTGKVHAIEPQAKKYEAALVAFDSMVAELADLRADNEAALLQVAALEAKSSAWFGTEAAKEVSRLRAEVQRLTAAAALAEQNRRFEQVRANRAEAEIRSLTKGDTT